MPAVPADPAQSAGYCTYVRTLLRADLTCHELSDADEKIIRGKRFLQELAGLRRRRLQLQHGVGVSGNVQRRHTGSELGKRPHQLGTGAAGHDDVGDDEVNGIVERLHARQCRGLMLRHQHPIAMLLEHLFQERTDRRIVFNEEKDATVQQAMTAVLRVLSESFVDAPAGTSG